MEIRCPFQGSKESLRRSRESRGRPGTAGGRKRNAGWGIPRQVRRRLEKLMAAQTACGWNFPGIHRSRQALRRSQHIHRRCIRLYTGTQQLYAGTSKLDSNSDALRSGAGQLVSGCATPYGRKRKSKEDDCLKLSSGATKLADGMDKYNKDGIKSLRNGCQRRDDELPKYQRPFQSNYTSWGSHLHKLQWTCRRH